MTKFARFIAVALVFLIVHQSQVSYAAPFQQQLQPGPGKKLVQGVFGPVEVDVSDPRPGIAFGPPLQPAAPATTPPVPAQAAPAVPATAPAPVNTQDPVIPVQLHFNNAEIHGVIDVIAGILAINYAVDPSVRGTVNLNSSGDIHRSDLLPILETILKMNGATMIKSGNFYQIVPSNTAVRNPIEVQSAVPNVAPDDQIIVQIVALKYVAADEMTRLLTPFLSESGSIVAQGGLLLITDRRSNLRKLLDIVDNFDSRTFEGERVRILPIKSSRVKDVADDLKTVFAGYALSTNTAIRFLPIERMNSVLVVSPNPSVFPEVERWLQQLDQPVQTSGLRNYVYRVQNAKAADIQRVLAELYGAALNPSTNTPAGARPIQGNAPAPPPAPPLEVTPGTLPSVDVAPAGARLTSELRVIADTINNALVIQATAQDYQTIERTIQDLDVLPRQVLIDTQVYEVTLDHSLQLGLSAVLQNRGTLANPQTTGSFSGAAGLAVTTFAFIGRSRELVAFLNAQENRSRVRTLSAPSILVSNNSQASVEVGAEIPVPTSSAASGAQQSGSTIFAQTIQFRDTGVILNVTPQINAGGNVTLNIAQEISQAQANTTSAIVAPVIGKSSVKSTIVVKDGETIPITGFIRESEELTRNRFPLLGDIPGVGLLFGDTNRSKSRTELIVLITPHVITTPDERSAAAEELKAKLKETQRLIN